MKLRKIFALFLVLTSALSLFAPKSAMAANSKNVAVPSRITIGQGLTATVDYMVTAKLVNIAPRWTSSNVKVVSVSQKGVIAAHKSGTATITVKVGKHLAKCKVTVDKSQSVNIDNALTRISNANKAAAPATVSVQDVLKILNQYRTSASASALAWDEDLAAAANRRAQEISILFDHTRPDGSACYTVSSKVKGENIAWCNYPRASGYEMATDAMNLWLNSPRHKDNMLNGAFRTLGVGYFNNNGKHYWVQLFG